MPPRPPRAVPFSAVALALILRFQRPVVAFAKLRPQRPQFAAFGVAFGLALRYGQSLFAGLDPFVELGSQAAGSLRGAYLSLGHAVTWDGGRQNRYRFRDRLRLAQLGWHSSA